MPLLSGVVEGFYGQPYSSAERESLLDTLARQGLNTYFYAPKDDLKHRAIWRQPYDADELASLRLLVEGCGERELQFFYGLSPGLDIEFSKPEEKEVIRTRFSQLREIGVRHFALLFDDLPGNLTEADRTAFPSLAAAQAAVTNAIHTWLAASDSEARLLFCPTPYCDRMDQEDLGGPGYLDILGGELAEPIDILWTGPEIISDEIPIDSIRRLTARIGRPPVLWDNLFANDYDLRRANVGPYAGRDATLVDHVRGILINPNNEYPLNTTPLETFSRYLTEGADYVPRAAFLQSIDRLVAHYAGARQDVSRDELLLLADCYYLPHHEGPTAVALYQAAATLVQQRPAEWGDAYETFTTLAKRYASLFEKLTELKDRALFYAWSRRAWELNEELDLLRQFVEKKKANPDEADAVAIGSHLPGTYRGGITARLGRLLTHNAQGAFLARPAKDL